MAIIASLKNFSARVASRFNDHVSHSLLSNGITLGSQRRFVALDNDISFNIWIRTGPYQDPADQRGSAHFLEHVLADIAKRQPEFEKRRGSFNATTNPESMLFYGTVKAGGDNLKFLIDQIDDILTSDISEEVVARERPRILNEIAIDYDQAEKVHLVLMNKSYKDEKGPGNVLGSIESVSATTSENLKNFKKKWFVGPNVCVTIVGDTGGHQAFHDAMKSRLEKLPGQSPQHFTPSFTPVDYREMHDRVHQLYFSLAFPVDPVDIKGSIATHFAANYIGRLATNKLVRSGLAYHASAICSFSYDSPGYIGVAGNVRPESAARVIPVISEIFAESSVAPDIASIELDKLNALDQIKSSRRFLPVVGYSPRGIGGDLRTHGRIITNIEEERNYASVAPMEIQTVIQNAIRQKPSIITYGDSSKLHSYDQFLEMLDQERHRLSQISERHI